MRPLQRAAACSILGISLVVSTAGAEIRGPHVTLSPYVGTSMWDDDFDLADEILFGGRAGINFLHVVGIEATYGLEETETNYGDAWKTDMEHVGVDLMVSLRPHSTINPYIIGGWAQLTHDSAFENDVVGGTRYVMKGWEAGGGLKVRLGETGGVRADLRFDARDVVSQPVQWIPGSDSDDHNFLFTAGLTFAFGASGTDTDGDGVKDHKDECPDTPLGAVVDAAGCPIDSDRDGVPDGLDACVDTPRGAVVSADGCPFDSDGDGIFDGLDRCGDTPAGALVDASGCPRDGDGDGVVDGIDRCADTPRGASVDATGCPSDADGDGVYDGIDLCANTPVDLEVDERGCPIEITATETVFLDTGVIRSSDIRFASGKADLEESSGAILDDIGRTLVQWPELRIEIGGHTDSRGSVELNQGLSERRAQAVLDYLIRRYPNIRAGQFTVRGYGESQPIASNETPAGRAQNRRVEFTVLNRDVLKREVEKRELLKR